MIDADEIVTKSLKLEIFDVIDTNDETYMFNVRRKDIFQEMDKIQ